MRIRLTPRLSKHTSCYQASPSGSGSTSSSRAPAPPPPPPQAPLTQQRLCLLGRLPPQEGSAGLGALVGLQLTYVALLVFICLINIPLKKERGGDSQILLIWECGGGGAGGVLLQFALSSLERSQEATTQLLLAHPWEGALTTYQSVHSLSEECLFGPTEGFLPINWNLPLPHSQAFAVLPCVIW